MALGILQPVLFAAGIEMGAGGLEVRWVALRFLVEMDGMFVRRQVFQRQLYFHTLSFGNHGCGSDAVALGVFQFNGLLGDRFVLRKGASAAKDRKSTRLNSSHLGIS